MADTGKLKRENTALLRQAMQHGSAGKNDLARLTHLSFPTVSRIVDEMVERGEAQEIGTAASTGGRCAMQYRLNPQYRLLSAAGAGHAALVCVRPRRYTARTGTADLLRRCARISRHASDAC